MQSFRSVQRISSQTQSLGKLTGIRALSTNIAGGGLGKAWADKEHAAENQYFNQKDAEVLAKLASKLKNHTAVRLAAVLRYQTSQIDLVPAP